MNGEKKEMAEPLEKTTAKDQPMFLFDGKAMTQAEYDRAFAQRVAELSGRTVIKKAASGK